MSDSELTHCLDLLADAVEPPPIDPDDIIAKARARSRRRRATGVTAFATVAVVGLVAVVLGPTAPHGGGHEAGRASSGYLPTDERGTRLSDELTRAWTRMRLLGVEVEDASGRSTHMTFRPMPTVRGTVYQALGRLSDAQGRTAIEIEVWHDPAPGDLVVLCVPDPGCASRQLIDGTEAVTFPRQANERVDVERRVEILRPDGTRTSVRETSRPGGGAQATRPSTILTFDQLVALTSEFTY